MDAAVYHAFEKITCPFIRILSMTVKIIFCQHQTLVISSRHLVKDVIERPLPEFSALECRHTAKVAIVGASLCRYDGRKFIIVFLLHKFAVWIHPFHKAERGEATLIYLLQFSRLKVLYYLWPQFFRFAHKNGVGIIGSFFRHNRGVYTAHNNGHAFFPARSGYFICPWRLVGNGRNADEVYVLKRKFAFIINSQFNIFVYKIKFPFTRSKSGNIGKVQRHLNDHRNTFLAMPARHMWIN